MTDTGLKFRVDIRHFVAHPFYFEPIELFYIDKLDDLKYYLDKYCNDKDHSVSVNIQIDLVDKKLWYDLERKRENETKKDS